VGDLEHVCLCTPKTICIDQRDQVHMEAMCQLCSSHHHVPQLQAAVNSSSCTAALLCSSCCLEMCTDQQQGLHCINCGTCSFADQQQRWATKQLTM
jgi:hypothetical protein